MRLPSIAIASLLLISPTVFANDACLSLLAVPLPPHPPMQAAPADCDPLRLYYGRDGQGEGRDDTAALACAWRLRPNELTPHRWPETHAIGVLMMIHANGRGAARNIPLAKRLACEYGGAPAELNGRLAHLDTLQRGDAGSAGDFDICDDVTSGAMMGWCSRLDANFADYRREQEWRAVTAELSAPQQHALAELRDSAQNFFRLSSRNENDMSGTMRGAIASGVEQNYQRQFLVDVRQLIAKPPSTAVDFVSEDRMLNAEWKRLMTRLRAGSETERWNRYGTLNPDEMRKAQRAWLHYRDVWGRFGHALHPAYPADVFRALQTRERSEKLKKILAPGI